MFERVRSKRRAAKMHRLRLEPLENRRLLTTFQVSDFNPSDQDSGADGTLRWAITQSNMSPADSGLNEIVFDVSNSNIQTITLGCALPTIAHPVEINGYCNTYAPYASPNDNPITGASDAVILVQLQMSPTASGTIDGLVLGAGSDGSIIRGLAIGGFSGYGIDVKSDSNTIAGDYIGTDASGSEEVANSLGGILIDHAELNTIGGPTAADRNVISGNGSSGDLSAAGVAITGHAPLVGADTVGNTVAGNFIGVAADGASRVGNSGPGVYIADGAQNNVLGGTDAGETNVISGNGSDGVWVHGTTADVENAAPTIYTIQTTTIDSASWSESGDGVVLSLILSNTPTVSTDLTNLDSDGLSVTATFGSGENLVADTGAVYTVDTATRTLVLTMSADDFVAPTSTSGSFALSEQYENENENVTWTQDQVRGDVQESASLCPGSAGTGI